MLCQNCQYSLALSREYSSPRLRVIEGDNFLGDLQVSNNILLITAKSFQGRHQQQTLDGNTPDSQKEKRFTSDVLRREIMNSPEDSTFKGYDSEAVANFGTKGDELIHDFHVERRLHLCLSHHLAARSRKSKINMIVVIIYWI
jgi:hypothetical protein